MRRLLYLAALSLIGVLVLALVVVWFLGFVVAHVGGLLIHLLLVVALVVLIINLLRSRRLDMRRER